MPAESNVSATTLMDVRRFENSESNSSQERKLDRACKEFESVFLSYLLKTMRASTTAFGTEDKPAGTGMMNDLMDEHLARALAENGGLGLARVLRARLEAEQGGEAGSGRHERPVMSMHVPSNHRVIGGPVSKSMSVATERIQRYEPIVVRAAKVHNLSPDLLKAVMIQESAGREDIVSSKGAKGLMQLMDQTAVEMGVSDPFDAEQNIFGGARYLRQLLDRWDGDLELALAAYNSGPATVEQHGGVPPFAETRDYVSRILDLLNEGEGEAGPRR